MCIYTEKLDYCVYLTIYSGNKLPPFYIGSSTIQKVNDGYHGSVKSKKYEKLWRSELKHNPQLFKTRLIRTFATKRDALAHERKIHLLLNVTHNPLYVNLSVAQVDGVFGYPEKCPVVRTVAITRKIEESIKKFWSSVEGELEKQSRKERTSGKNNPQYGKTGELATCYGRTGEKHPMHGLRGEKSPNYGSKRTIEQRRNMSLNHPDISGAKNPRAIRWLLTSPDGSVTECIGNLEQVVEELGLGITSLKTHIGKPVPENRRATSPISKKTVGWKLEKVNKPS